MSNIVSLLVRNLFDVFGGRDPARRRQAIADIWTEDCVFADHDGVRSGRDALAASVAALQAKFPSFVFT